MQRYLSIDILRGMAIILMIQVHFVDNLSSREEPSRWLYDASMMMGSLAAPLFTFLSGASYYLWVRKQESQQRRDKEITRITLRRGLFLFGVGLVFNFAIWLPEETFNWDILTLLGTGMVVLAFARKLPVPVLGLICGLVVLASPLMRLVGDASSYWEDNAYSYDFTFRDVLFGFISNGYFPVFPWIVFPILGFLCGEVIFKERRRPGSAHRWAGLLGVGLLALAGFLVVVGAKLPAPIARNYASGSTEFPASTEHVLVMLGMTLLSLLLFHRWVDRKAESSHRNRFVTIINRFSSFSLSVYVLHHMVMLWPLWIYGALTGHDDSTVFWRRAMSTPLAFGLAVAFVFVCHFILLVLERHKQFSLESLMRRICDGKQDAAKR